MGTAQAVAACSTVQLPAFGVEFPQLKPPPAHHFDSAFHLCGVHYCLGTANIVERSGCGRHGLFGGHQLISGAAFF